MSIVVTSGSVIGKDPIQDTIDRAVARGMAQGLTDAWIDFSPTVAMKTGKMRDAVFKAMRQIAAQTLRSNPIVEVTWDSIKERTISFLAYSEYHFKARGFYVNPTTPGTFPMRASRFNAIARPIIRKEISKWLKKSGLEERATFSVS